MWVCDSVEMVSGTEGGMMLRSTSKLFFLLDDAINTCTYILYVLLGPAFGYNAGTVYDGILP